MHENNRPRITGVETEFGFVYELQQGNGCYDFAYSPHADTILSDNLPAGIHRTNKRGMLSNGARVYIDIGAHPEFSTAEAATFKDVIAQDLAGERIIFQSFQRMAERGMLKSFQLNKRVADMCGTYWGRHENYLVPRTLDTNTEIVPQVALHLATRSIWAGAGMLRPDSEYVMAQKINAIRTLCSYSASREGLRPLVDIGRDEPHADKSLWRRLHVASADSNMFPWTSWMSLGTTSIVLRMVEQGDDLSDLHLYNPVQAAHKTIRDLDLNASLSLKNSTKPMTALDIQEALAERACVMSQNGCLPPEEQQIAAEWMKLCQDLRRDSEQCAERVEWIAKYMFLGKVAAKKNIAFHSEPLRKLDIAWDNLDTDKGIAQKIRAKRSLPEIVSEEEVQAAMIEPPHTRAHTRGRLIKNFASLQNLESPPISEHIIDWHEFAIKHSKGGNTGIYQVVLNDPYETESAEADEMLYLMSKF